MRGAHEVGPNDVGPGGLELRTDLATGRTFARRLLGGGGGGADGAVGAAAGPPSGGSAARAITAAPPLSLPPDDDARADGEEESDGDGGRDQQQQQHHHHPALLAAVHTFGKAIGGHGAAVLGSATLKAYLLNYARPLIYSTRRGVYYIMYCITLQYMAVALRAQYEWMT